MNAASDFLTSSIKRFAEYKLLAEKAMQQLNEEDLHFIPNAASNSIAIIIQHLHGNMVSRWTGFLTEDGEKPWRKRDEEFEEISLTHKELMEKWEEGWKVLFDSLGSLTREDLEKTVTIRLQPQTVTDAILRQLAHYSYHVGQIVYLARMIKNTAWQSLSIPKGGSHQYNKELKKSYFLSQIIIFSALTIICNNDCSFSYSSFFSIPLVSAR